MKVTAIQCDLAWEDPAANRAALLPRIEAAVAEGAALVALPEMFTSGFSMRTAELAEPEGGPSETFLAETAARLGIALCGGLIREHPGWARPRNVLTFALPDGSLQRYAKIHTFTYGGESDHYEAGTEALTVEVGGVRVTPLICYDLRFPELFAPLAAGTDLFLVAANWPVPRAAAWRALLVARAMENQCYVLGVNRVGTGAGNEYRGDSMLVGPLGEILADAEPGAPALVSGEVDPEQVAETRRRFGFLADRRPDVYSRLGRPEPC